MESENRLKRGIDPEDIDKAFDELGQSAAQERERIREEGETAGVELMRKKDFALPKLDPEAASETEEDYRRRLLRHVRSHGSRAMAEKPEEVEDPLLESIDSVLSKIQSLLWKIRQSHQQGDHDNCVRAKKEAKRTINRIPNPPKIRRWTISDKEIPSVLAGKLDGVEESDIKTAGFKVFRRVDDLVEVTFRWGKRAFRKRGQHGSVKASTAEKIELACDQYPVFCEWLQDRDSLKLPEKRQQEALRAWVKGYPDRKTAERRVELLLRAQRSLTKRGERLTAARLAAEMVAWRVAEQWPEEGKPSYHTVLGWLKPGRKG